MAFGFVMLDGTMRVVYRAQGNHHIHMLDFLPRNDGVFRWADGDLTAQGGGKAAASSPTGFVLPDGTMRVVYASEGDNHIHMLDFLPRNDGVFRWADGDLTAQAGGPSSTGGTPFGFALRDGTMRVVYASDARHVHMLDFLKRNDGVFRWADGDLTTQGGGKAAFAIPYAFSLHDDTMRVVYLSEEGRHVHMLDFLKRNDGVFRWANGDLTAQARGVASANSCPFGYPMPDGTMYVFYTARGDHHVHMMDFRPREDGIFRWADTDLTVAGNGRPAISPVFGFALPDRTVRVVYASEGDNHIHMLDFLPRNDGVFRWADGDLTAQAGGPSSTGGTPFGFALRDGTMRVVYASDARHVHMLDFLKRNDGVFRWADGDLTAQAGGVPNG